MHIAIITATAIVAHAGLAGAARHVPPGDAVAGSTIELVVEAPGSTPPLAAHYRAAGTGAFTTLELVRKDAANWVAVVPAAAVVVPGLEYFIDAGGQAVFASAQWPHTMLVRPSSDDARRARDTLRSAGRRYRVQTVAEYVDFGARMVDSVRTTDNYYRIDADFSYRLWAYPLDKLEFGYTRLLGGDGSGFKVGGFFGLGVGAEGVQLDGRLYALATPNGFQLGARSEARVGILEASHIAAGAEYLADVGASGYFRLGWGTVPGLAMAATVEATNLPASSRRVGVRLFYDVARELAAGLRIGVRFGYAARDQQVNGLTGGATASLDF